MRQRLLLCLQLLISAVSGFGQQTSFIVKAGSCDRDATPVSFQSAKALPPGEYMLINQRTKKRFNAQVLAGSQVNFILPEKLMKGAEAAYLLQRNPVSPKRKLKVAQDSSGISVLLNNKQIFFYHTSEAKPPVDSPAYYQRSGFIHPLRTPSGRIVTDDFPAGHAHQHGIMMAWANTSFKNTAVDFWNQQHKTGNVRHVNVLSVEQGSTLARVKLQLQHYSHEHGVILNETWTINCYPFTDYYLFDIISEQENTSSDSLLLKKYHYGGMEFRGSREWNEDDKKHFTNKWIVRTDRGFDTSNANARPAAYVDVSGKINGRYCGVTVFSFPANFRYPEPIRLHPTMPYWCFAPTVNEGFSLAPANRFVSQYRYFVYDGKRDQQRITAINNNISKPLIIEEMR
jgi:hypothetical protein